MISYHDIEIIIWIFSSIGVLSVILFVCVQYEDSKERVKYHHRIIVDGNCKYFVQRKQGLFGNWYTLYQNLTYRDAQEYLKIVYANEHKRRNTFKIRVIK